MDWEAAALGAVFVREDTIGAGGAVKAARRTEDENIPCERKVRTGP
jgi:hypothetical protein